MRIIKTIISCIGVLFGFVPDCGGAVQTEHDCWFGLDKEISTIYSAAMRNGCKGVDFLLLCAIRKAENGDKFREFGIIHPACEAAMEAEPNRTIDIQAGRAAATIMKNRKRWAEAGMPGTFIEFLADKYCPKECDTVGNLNWKRNVKFWFKKFSLQHHREPRIAGTKKVINA